MLKLHDLLTVRQPCDGVVDLSLCRGGRVPSTNALRAMYAHFLLQLRDLPVSSAHTPTALDDGEWFARFSEHYALPLEVFRRAHPASSEELPLGESSYHGVKLVDEGWQLAAAEQGPVQLLAMVLVAAVCAVPLSSVMLTAGMDFAGVKDVRARWTLVHREFFSTRVAPGGGALLRVRAWHNGRSLVSAVMSAFAYGALAVRDAHSGMLFSRWWLCYADAHGIFGWFPDALAEEYVALACYYTLQLCAVCGATTRTRRACGRCMRLRYCSARCEKADAERHAHWCMPLRLI